jgi:hypothetical protein
MHTPRQLPPSVTLQELSLAFRQHRLLLTVILLHAAAALALVLRHPSLADDTGITAAIGTSLLLGPCYMFCGYALYVMIKIRPRRLFAYLFDFIVSPPTVHRLAQALPVLLSIPVFTYSFATIKAAVPVVHPYALDAQLYHLDLVMHGGVAPWVWLQYVFGYPLLTAAINVVYHLWYFLVMGTLYLLALSSGRPQLRMQFLLSFVLSWIVLGNLLALVASSAGPCYYGRIVPGTDPYAPLIAYLQEANRHFPVWALNVQDILWANYKQSFGSSALGIAAMPSMHVASSVLVALLGWRVHRGLGIAGTIFTLLIMIGSVHLGWHYALDGYVGAAGALLIWRLAGHLTSATRHTVFVPVRTPRQEAV